MDRKRLYKGYFAKTDYDRELELIRWNAKQEAAERAKKETLAKKQQQVKQEAIQQQEKLQAARKQAQQASIDQQISLLRPENQYSNFLASERNKMFDTVERQSGMAYKNAMIESTKEKQKTQDYLEKTNPQKAKEFRNLATGQMSPDMINTEKPEGYGVLDYLQDAYTVFGESTNEALANNYYGQWNRTLEGEDLRTRAIQEQYDKKKLDVIDLYLKISDAFYQAKDTDEVPLQTAMRPQLNKALAQLRKYYPNINPDNPSDFNKMMSDRNQIDHKLNVEVSATETLSKMSRDGVFNVWGRKLGNAIHNISNNVKNVGNKIINNMMPVALGGVYGNVIKNSLNALGINTDNVDYVGNFVNSFGDRTDDAYSELYGFDTASPEERLKMLENFGKRNQENQKYFMECAEQNEKEKEAFTKQHEVSLYFKNRALKGQMELAEGGSLWDMDNMLYTNVQQLGFSSSAWDKQLTSMGLQILAGVFSGGTSVALAGAGSLMQYEAGRSENNAEVVENLKSRIKNCLDDDLTKQVLEEGKKQFPELSDDEIFELIAKGRWLPNKSKALASISDQVRDALAEARAGSNALYQRDMYAVASDSMVDGLLSAADIGKMFGKGFGSKINAGLNDSSKYRLLRRKTGEWIADYAPTVNRLTRGVGSAYATGLESGVGMVSGAVTAGSRMAYNTAEEVARHVDPRKAAQMRFWRMKANKALDFKNAIPDYIFRNMDPEKAYLAKKKWEAGRKVLSFAGKLALRSQSEAIEEGKQYLNAQEWINNSDPDRVVGLVDGLLRDSSLGFSLLPAAMGIPFGAKWGLTNSKNPMYAELYSNMAGGWLGGFGHGATIGVGQELLKLPFSPNRMSIATALVQNADLDTNTSLTRYQKGTNLAAKAVNNIGAALDELNQYREFNQKREREGYSSVPEELLDEEEKYLKLLSKISNSAVVKQQAEAAGIKFKSPEYYKFVSALTMYRDLKKQYSQNAEEFNKQENDILTNAASSMLYEDETERAAAASILGEEVSISNPLLDLVRSSNVESTEEETEVEDERIPRLKGESKSDYNKRVLKIRGERKRLKIENDTEYALNSSVATPQSAAIVETDEQLLSSTISTVSEIIALQEMYDNIDTLNEYADKRDKHDVDYFKREINSRLEKLKSKIGKEALDTILNDPEGYIDAETLKQLKELYQAKMSNTVEYKVTQMLEESLTGKMDIEMSREGRILLKGWRASNAKEVISALDKSIDNEYKLIDTVNKDFEERAVGKKQLAERQAAVTELALLNETPLTEEQQRADQILEAAEYEMDQDESNDSQLPLVVAPEFVPLAPSDLTPIITEPGETPGVIVVDDIQLDEALGEISNALGEELLADYQTLNNALTNPALLNAGTVVVKYVMQNGAFKFKDVIEKSYDVFKSKGLSDQQIFLLAPYFGQWYNAAQLSFPLYDDQFNTNAEVRAVNVKEVLDSYIFGKQTAEEQDRIWNNFKKDVKDKNDLAAVYESVDELLAGHASAGEKVAIVDRNTKNVLIYTIKSTKDGHPSDVVDVNNITVIANGSLLTASQIDNQYEQNTNKNDDQDSVMSSINKKIDDDLEQIVGVTGHDYFVRENGRIEMYPRVHTVLGDQYVEKDSVRTNRDNYRTQVSQLIREGKIDELKLLVKDIDGYQMYLDYLNENPSKSNLVTEALADLLAKEKLGPAVKVGQIADEIVRVFFDANPDKSLDYDTFTVKIDNKEYSVSNVMTRDAFDQFISTLNTLKQEYDRLGYKLNTRRHTWFAKVRMPDGTYRRVAGETDVIAVDEQGKVHIIDTKTSKSQFGSRTYVGAGGISVTTSPFTDAHDLYDGRKALRSTKNQYERQLSMYMLLIQTAMPEIQFAENPLEVLPVNVKYDYSLAEANFENPGHNSLAITEMSNGLNGEPLRVELSVQTDIINGQFGVEENNDQLKQEIKDLATDLMQQVDEVKSQIDEQYNEANKKGINGDEKFSLAYGLINYCINELSLMLDNIKQNISKTKLENSKNILPIVSRRLEEAKLELEKQINQTEQEPKNIPGLNERQNKFDSIYLMYRKAYDAYLIYNKVKTSENWNNMAEIFDQLISMVEDYLNQYDNTVELELIIIPSIDWYKSQQAPVTQAPKPVVTQRIGGDGWKQHNTADMNSDGRGANKPVSKSRALDDPKLKLEYVTAYPDFGEKSICEVVGNVYTRADGTTVVPVLITYGGHTYSTIEIQAAQNQMGKSFAQTVKQLYENKQEGLKIILTGMNRTLGKPLFENQMQSVLNSPIIPDGVSIYDISTESTQSTFGLSKIDKTSGRVVVKAQGATVSGSTVLYEFAPGKANAGSVYAVITPDYRNADKQSEPLAFPLINPTLSDDDINLLIDLFNNFKAEEYPVTLEDGSQTLIPLSAKDIISMFIPVGRYDGKTYTATYVDINGPIVTFSYPPRTLAIDPQTYQEIKDNGYMQFDMSNDMSLLKMKEFMSTIRLNVREDILDCRLGEARNGSHPFKRLALWFERRSDQKSIRFGKSTLRFDREDFKDPNNPSDKKGLSGLAWMMKNGMLNTRYSGIQNARFSFTDAQYQEESIETETPSIPIEESVDIEEYSADDIDVFDPTDYDEGNWDKKQVRKPLKTITKEKVIARLHKIFGEDIPVEVVENIYDSFGSFLPGVVGRCYKDVIRICERAEEGTEFHEAFHRVSLLMLPKLLQKQLYKGIKKAMKRRYGAEFVQNATDRQLEEFGANECARYFLRNEQIMNDIRHPLDFIRNHYRVYKRLGSFRMYMLYTAMKNGVFKHVEAKQDRNIPEAYKFQIHEVGFEYIFGDKMYDSLKKSLMYYITYAQGIRKDGKNISDLDLSSSEIFDKEFTHKGPKKTKDGRVIYKDGKPVIEEYTSTIRKIMMSSCKSPLGKLAVQEAIDKWDVVKKDMLTYVGELGIDYNEKTDLDNDDAALSGEHDGENENWLGNHIKNSNESSHTARATSGIRFFTSMIKKWETTEDGKQREVRNEIGFYEFEDSKDVLNKILGDCHDVKAPSEMIERMKDLSKTDKMYEQVYKIVNRAYKQTERKDGTLNADNEQFVTQLFNLVSSYQMVYKRITANKYGKDVGYAMKVEDCGQEYEAYQTRSDWGRLLTYGGTPLFTRNQDGQISLKDPRSIQLMGSVFDKLSEIQKAFSQDNVNKLLAGDTPTLVVQKRTINVTNEDDLIFLKRAMSQMFNYIGIEFSVPNIDYMLREKYGKNGYTTLFSQMQAFFQEDGLLNIQNLWSSDVQLIKKDKNGNWQWNVWQDNKIHYTKNGKQLTTNAEHVYVHNSFCSELSKYKYKYDHMSSELSVLVTKGDRYYTIAENNTISDVTDNIAKNGSIAEMLSRFCYNYVESRDDENNIKSQEGSILLKAIRKLAPGAKLPIKFCTLVQFKTNEYGDEGSGYFDISEREDYTAKATILEQGGLIFPTMSDKKSWGYLEGITLPGITYGEDKNHNPIVVDLSEDEVLEQLVEYADTEYFSIKLTLLQLKELGDDHSKKIVNFHEGKKDATIIDVHGVKHKIAQGTIFSSLTGVYDRNGNLISFNRVLDENGEYISPEKNLQLAEQYFFGLGSNPEETRRLKKQAIKRIIDQLTKRELKHLEGLGLITRNKNNSLMFDNVGLNQNAIEQIARAMFNLSENQKPNFVYLAQATERYVRDIVSKSIMSIQEVERVYSGHPAFFKYEFTYKNRKNKEDGSWTKGDGVLVNRSVDEFKRLGGLISTGTNNNIEIKGIPADGKYVCAEVNNDEVASVQLERITELMSRGEWRQAYRQLFKMNKEEYEKLDKMTTEEIKSAVEKKNKLVHDIIVTKLDKEVSAYKKGIDVADGGAYISPKMTEWLLRMCGSFDNKVQKAFEILENPDKYDIETQADAYKTVTTKVIGALKYTAYGMRLSEDGKTTIPYYNKMALFPVFKCIATGKFAKLYKQMEDLGIHMLMINSAVKVGSQGSIDYDPNADNFTFNTYKLDFIYLRKQFNTDPHHKDEQAMGTQMVKVALASLIADETYTKEDGSTVSGRQLLNEIMEDIKKLSKAGNDKIKDILYDELGNIDQNKLSKFLREQLSSRDADKSILDSISFDEKSKLLKHPLAAISRMGWLQSILTSFINKRIVDVNTPGNAFYQRSIWNMEGSSANVLNDENLPSDINGGKDLQMIIEDGPAKGAMDCVLTIDYFAEILKEAGLDDASFAEQKKALMEAGVIGPNAKASLIGYRIPTQAQSSIHPLRCVDVLPVIQHNIILPKEFTRITGSDFDIDKIFIASLNFNLKQKADGSWYNAKLVLDDVQNTQNRLIENYISVLRNENSVHIAQRSIDNDTELLKDVLDDIEGSGSVQNEVQPYDFYCLRTHTESKNDFLTGKTGIGPFALNNNSLILTMLYGVQFNGDGIMGQLGHASLHSTVGMDQQSILSWISALINAHVDIAKDPYISRLNVNQMTYNLTNLLIRTGYGKNTFYFLTQPVMKAMAQKHRQAQGKFMLEQGKSSWLIQKEAKRTAADQMCGKALVDLWEEKMKSENKKGELIWNNTAYELATAILEDHSGVIRKISRGEIGMNSSSKYEIAGRELSVRDIQAIVYLVDNMLEQPAQAISDLVKYSKIDTKKLGKNISEQLAYLKGVANIFGDNEILQKLYGAEVEEEYTGPFDFYGIQRMYSESFIKQKTHDAIFTFMDILKGQVLEATPGFQNIVDRIASMLGKSDAKSIESISNAVSAKIKSQAINKYASDNDIDIPGLVSGNNTIYDRLNKIKCEIKANPDKYKLLHSNGDISNALLKLLIADKTWNYDKTSHPGLIDDPITDLKFVRLFDALDMSTSKTDYIIQAWDDLLNLGEGTAEKDAYKEIRDFARDLCVYAFVTSGDQGGRTKIFQYVPNSFREESGYVQHLRNMIDNLQNPLGSADWFKAEFIDDVILNNWTDYTFVPNIDISNKNRSQTDPIWRDIHMNLLVTYNDKKYTPNYPIFLTSDVTTPVKDDEIKPYIKIKRDKFADDSHRSYTVMKLVAKVPSDKKGYSYPIYVKTNPISYSITGGYNFYQYGGESVLDEEYYPSVNGIINMISYIESNRDQFVATYGEEFIRVARGLYETIIMPEYEQGEQWVGHSKKVYKPELSENTPKQENTSNVTVTGENISSKGSEFAKKLTNVGNDLQVEYKGVTFRNAEHAYLTWKSGQFDNDAYNSTNTWKPVGSKSVNKNVNFQIMVEILTAKLQQHPELIEGINQRGGIDYINASTHNVVGDRYWETNTGQNAFIKALAQAYNNVITKFQQKSLKQNLSSVLDDYQQFLDKEEGKTDSENRLFAEDTNVPTDDKRGFKVEKSTSVLDSIILNTNNLQYKKLAQWLKKYVEKHEVDVFYTNRGAVDETEYIGGLTHTHMNQDGSIGLTIEIFTNSVLYKQHPEQTLLHEILHSVTSTVVKIFRSRNNSTDLNTYIDYIKQQIDNIRPGFSENIYGLKSAEEFVSEYYTNPAFQNILKNIPAMDTNKFKNLFDEIVNWIMKVINIEIKESENAFDQLRPIMYGIIECESKLDFSNKSLALMLRKQAGISDKQSIPENYPLTKRSISFVWSRLISINHSGKSRLEMGLDIKISRLSTRNENGEDFKYIRLSLINKDKQELYDKLVQDIIDNSTYFKSVKDGQDLLISHPNYKYEEKQVETERNNDIDVKDQEGWYDKTRPESDELLRLQDRQERKYHLKNSLDQLGEEMMKTCGY